MDEILIYDAIKFQRVVPARAKFVRFIRSQFESFSLTVKPLGGRWRDEGQKPEWKRRKRRWKEEVGTAEESVGDARGGWGEGGGNIVLNRKIGILINTRGLSIKGRGKRAHEGVAGGADGGTMTRSVRFILRASPTLALMSSLTRPEVGPPSE